MAEAVVTEDGTEVKVGQTWRALNDSGLYRWRVQSIDRNAGLVTLVRVGANYSLPTKGARFVRSIVRIELMGERVTGGGWRLVEGPTHLSRSSYPLLTDRVYE